MSETTHFRRFPRSVPEAHELPAALQVDVHAIYCLLDHYIDNNKLCTLELLTWDLDL